MAEIIGIRFKREGKQYHFDPAGHQVSPGDGVIVETSWGIEYGECVRGNSEIPDEELVAPLRPVIRVATEEDMETVQKNRERERQAFRLCQEKIQQHKLDMKLVEVEYSFEGSKILFFFTSDGRVDFRGLVKDLAAVFHTRIELRQIGVRDEARMLGGLGICGREFCCASFLKEFQPVSIKMAKTQSLSLNPAKISGSCGRLMCCLMYEQHAYEDLLKHSPKADSFVETPDGVGDIVSVNTLREKVRVRLDNAPDSLKVYHNNEIRVVRSGKGKRPEGYVAPPLDELAALRRVTEPTVQTATPEFVPTALRRFTGEQVTAEEQRSPAEGDRKRSRNRNDRRRGEQKVEENRFEQRKPEHKKPDQNRSEPKKFEQNRAAQPSQPQKAESIVPEEGQPVQPNREGKSNNRRRSKRPGRQPEKGTGQERQPKEPREEQVPSEREGTQQKSGEKSSRSSRWRRRPRGPGGGKKPPEGGAS